LQEITVGTEKLKKMILGTNRERVKKMEVRVGAELAHMMRQTVKVAVKVNARKNAALPLHHM
jgi:GTPase Era involved in 16S rRNA processing